MMSISTPSRRRTSAELVHALQPITRELSLKSQSTAKILRALKSSNARMLLKMLLRVIRFTNSLKSYMVYLFIPRNTGSRHTFVSLGKNSLKFVVYGEFRFQVRAAFMGAEEILCNAS